MTGFCLSKIFFFGLNFYIISFPDSLSDTIFQCKGVNGLLRSFTEIAFEDLLTSQTVASGICEIDPEKWESDEGSHRPIWELNAHAGIVVAGDLGPPASSGDCITDVAWESTRDEIVINGLSYLGNAAAERGDFPRAPSLRPLDMEFASTLPSPAGCGG